MQRSKSSATLDLLPRRLAGFKELSLDLRRLHWQGHAGNATMWEHAAFARHHSFPQRREDVQTLEDVRYRGPPQWRELSLCMVCAAKLYTKFGCRAGHLKRHRHKHLAEIAKLGWSFATLIATGHAESPLKNYEALVQRIIARYILWAGVRFWLAQDLLWQGHFSWIARTTNTRNCKRRYNERTIPK